MSISLYFNHNTFELEKLNLPSRYYYFNQKENYVKLLSIAEGIFPKDRIKTRIGLNQSNAIITTESATKVYPSNKEYGINHIQIALKNHSNLEYINDELILFKEAKLMQFYTLTADTYSTFFYADVLSSGRSFEHFDFTHLITRNRFIIDHNLEYFEEYQISGEELKNYLQRHKNTTTFFAKIYLKALDNKVFLEQLHRQDIQPFTFSSNQQMLLGIFSHSNMAKLKTQVLNIWELYRQQFNKTPFDLGKQ
jgi:urease accessory protein